MLLLNKLDHPEKYIYPKDMIASKTGTYLSAVTCNAPLYLQVQPTNIRQG
jgi:hypothetical protein